ncbi:anosmin-1-like [Lytechinus pictus]|uniref:anosmin-1-like n=1 Tax=Lytechinus pictus TaxID=7653 RepID=UPI0030B9F85D
MDNTLPLSLNNVIEWQRGFGGYKKDIVTVFWKLSSLISLSLSFCFILQVTSSALHTNSLLEECTNNINCSSCIYPCKKYHKSLDTCKAKCQTQTEAVSAPDICISSCNFIKYIKNAKIGACPSTFGGFAEACVNECDDDQGCKGEKKCCNNGCGRTCQVPNIRRKDYPARVERRWATITENEEGDSATVRWRPVPNLTDSGILLYAIQAKNLSQTRSQVSWYDVGVTEETDIRVPLQVGREYQFRIASVNENGTLGYFRPTVEFSLSKEPERPSPPFSIVTGPVQIINEKIHMTLYWSPPRYSDLPISRYRVFYSERRAVTPSIIAVKEHRLDVPGSETTCILPDLLPGMKYFVQVKAIARYRDNRLSSDRESTYIYTPTPASNDGTGGKLTQTYVHPKVTAPSGKMPGPPGDLTHNSPYWDNGTLKVRLTWQKPKGFELTIDRFTIHWEATVCSSESGQEEGEATSYGFLSNDIYTPYRQKAATTHDTSFELYDLSFDCTYEVWVRPVYDHGWGPFDSTIQILTPPCTEVISRGPRPTCPTPIPDIPSAPINMSYTYGIGETVSANFTWAPPTRSQYPLSGYRIYWAKVKPSSGLPHAALPTIEREEFISTLLRETQRWYVIRNLTAGARYVVKLQALSSIGGGANVAVDIQTPDIKIKVNTVLPSEDPHTSDPNLIEEPSRPQGNNSAAERLVGSYLILTLLTILCLCHVIQR